MCSVYSLLCSHFEFSLGIQHKEFTLCKRFFVLLEHLYVHVFISTTKAHVIFMCKQIKLYPDMQPRQLQKLSDTQWVCRYAAVSAIYYTYDSILFTMKDVMSRN